MADPRSSSGPVVNINTLREDKPMSEQIANELRLHHGFQLRDYTVCIATETGWPIAVVAKLNDGSEVTHSVVYVGRFG